MLCLQMDYSILSIFEAGALDYLCTVFFLYICIEKYIIKKMKKLMMVALCALGFAVSASAQDTFRRGDKVLNVGIGVPAENYVDFPPLSATYEQSIADNIGDKGSVGLGAQVEFMGAAKRVSIFMGPRAAFHYEFVDKLDTYVGVQAGLGLAKSSLSFDWAGVIGARYYLGEKVGVFGEFGTGFSVFKLGATFRL